MLRRDVIVVSGADARTYLHGQLAQDVAGLAVGESRWTLVLEPNGRVSALARVAALDDDRFALDVDAGFGEELDARLNRFRIRVDVTTELTENVDVDPQRLVGWWAMSLAERSWAEDLAGLDTGADVGEEVYEIRRVAAGWPAMGREIRAGESIPAETGVLDVAVLIGKGCYPGQELVERMDSRGAAGPRRLVKLGAEGRVPGDPVTEDGTAVGLITSVAGDHALALVGRNATVGTPVGRH